MATSLPTHKTNRDTAGAAYAAAAAAYINAWIELAAYDTTLANHNIGGGSQPGFGDQPHVAGHGTYLRDIPAIGTNIAGRVKTRAEQLIAS